LISQTIVLSLVFSIDDATLKLTTVLVVCNAGHIDLFKCGVWSPDSWYQIHSGMSIT